MSDQLAQVIIYLLVVMIRGLFELDNLKTCAAPLHIYIIVFWVLILGIAISVGASVSIRSMQTIGAIFGFILFVLFCIWNLSGIVMYSVSMVKTPDCMSRELSQGLIFFFIICFVLFIFGLFVVCVKGTSQVFMLMRNQTEANRNIQNLANGQVRAQELIRQDRGVDTYALFADEKQKLLETCSYYYQANAALNESRVEDCVICYSDYQDGDKIIDYPMCKHKYHADCLLEWIKTRTTCPVCRRGIRSSLYEAIEERGQGRHPIGE